MGLGFRVRVGVGVRVGVRVTVRDRVTIRVRVSACLWPARPQPATSTLPTEKPSVYEPG